jgi:hypothetical protein
LQQLNTYGFYPKKPDQRCLQKSGTRRAARAAIGHDDQRFEDRGSLPEIVRNEFFPVFQAMYMVRQIDFEESDVSNPFALNYPTLLFKKLALGKISSGWKSGKIVPTAYGMASSLMNHI